MKFRFCGDQDCPDWFLTQMAALSRLSSVKAKLLGQHVARHLTRQHILDMDKLTSLISDSKFSGDDLKGLVSALEYVLSSASRFAGVSEDHLRAELHQVGLPKEHAAAIAKVHRECSSLIRDELIKDTLQLNRVTAIRWGFTQGADDQPGRLIEMNLAITSGSVAQDVSFTVDPAKLQILLYELEQIRDEMRPFLL